MMQHLYAINSYRNLFEHVDEQSYRCQSHNTDVWG